MSKTLAEFHIARGTNRKEQIRWGIKWRSSDCGCAGFQSGLRGGRDERQEALRK